MLEWGRARGRGDLARDHWAAVLIATVGVAVGVHDLPASAQASVKITYRDAFTTQAPAASSGRVFQDEFANSTDPQAKPSALSHFHLQLPAGARFDTTAIAQCQASDLELMLEGASACPTTSKLGTETFTFDTGLPGSGRYEPSDVTFLNQLGGVILLSQDRQSGVRLVIRGKVGSDTEDIDLPLLPGTPPDGGADKSEVAQYPAATGVSNGQLAAYLTTPPSCPRSGEWLFRAVYTFRDGTQQTADSSSPCQTPAPAPVLSSHRPTKAAHRRMHRHARGGRSLHPRRERARPHRARARNV
jgi:hypothetical protein